MLLATYDSLPTMHAAKSGTRDAQCWARERFAPSTIDASSGV